MTVLAGVVSVWIALAGVPLARGQNLANLPPCAASCATGGLSATGCNLLDVACICKSSAFIDSLVPCIKTNCNAADQQTTIQFAQNLCAGAGVTLSNAAAMLSSAKATGSATGAASSGAASASAATTPRSASASASGSQSGSTGASASKTTMSGSAATTSAVSASSTASATGSAASSALATASKAASAAAAAAPFAAYSSFAGCLLSSVLLALIL